MTLQRDSVVQADRRRRRRDHRRRHRARRRWTLLRTTRLRLHDHRPASCRTCRATSCSSAWRPRRSCSFPPVIVYTGRNLTRDEEAELLRYSRSIIIKGARSPERLLDEVTLFLHKVESRAVERAPEACSRPRAAATGLRGPPHPAGGRRRAQHLRADQRAGAARAPSVEIGRNGREALEKLDRSATTSTWC